MKPMKPLYVIIIAIVVGAAAFYGGMQYQKSQRASFAMGANGAADGQFGRRMGGVAGNFQGGGGNAQAMRPVSGQIVSQDSKSITVKMSDGSSKIVNLSDQTKINKASTGSTADLKSGTQVSVFGTTNSDGSVTAQMVSIGGNMMFRRGDGQAPSQEK